MKRFFSLLVVICICFCLFLPAYALEGIPEFDSDFMRYAPSSGSVTVGSDSHSIVLPWMPVSSTSYQSVKSLDASCNAIGNLHGHFTFVLIVGSRSNPSLVSNVRSVSIETIDSRTNLHYYTSSLRPTNYNFEYAHQTVTQGEVHTFNCIPFICEFDIPEGETFTSLYSNDSNVIVRVNGDYITAAFFLYSSTKNSSLEHLYAIEDYVSVLPSYLEHFDILLGDTNSRVNGIYTFYSTVSSRFNSTTSRNATWDNMPDTPNPYNALADMMHALLTEKKNQATKENQLSNLTDLQDTVISNTSDNLPKFTSGLLNIFNFFDISDSDVSLDFSNAFLGYEDYFGNVPFFFSSDIESRLEVQ